MEWNIINTVLEVFLTFPFQLFIGALLFCIHVSRRKYFLVRFIPSVALIFLLHYLFVFGLYGDGSLLGWVNVLFIFAAELLFIALCFKCDWRQTVFVGSGSYALQHFISCFNTVIGRHIFSFVPETGGWHALLNCALILISAGIFYGFHRFFVRRMLAQGGFEGFANIRDIHIILLSSVTVAIVCMVSILASVNGKDIYHNIYACCCCLLLLLLQFGIFEHGAEKKKRKTSEELLEYEHEQRRLAKETIEILNRKSHDLKHRIESIQKIIEDEALDGKLKNLYEAARTYDTFLDTGNSALDVLLTEKNLYCNKYGIRFTCIADGGIVNFMSDEDIYCLFGNALDNAIESVSGEEENRWISLNLHKQNGFAVLHTDNWCPDTPIFKNGLPLTTKSDGTKHGQGMTGMKYVAEKYGGTLTVGCKDHIFSLNVIIPIPVN